MPSRTVFSDDTNELDVYVNARGKLYIGVGTADPDDHIYSGTIELERDDVDELIKVISKCREEMDEAVEHLANEAAT